MSTIYILVGETSCILRNDGSTTEKQRAEEIRQAWVLQLVAAAPAQEVSYLRL